MIAASPEDDSQKSPQELAKDRLERAFRVRFAREPLRATEQTLILLAADRIAAGEGFRWEGTREDPQLRFGTADEEESLAQESDQLALEAEDTTVAQEIVAKYESEKTPEGSVSKSLPVRELTGREARFVRCIVAGMTQINAYYAAGYKASTRESAHTCASIIANKPHIQAYLRKLKESVYLADVLTFAEKRHGLAQAWRTPVGEVDENHPLAQEVTYDETVDKDGNVVSRKKKVKMVPKLQALELDAKLAGELREQTQVNVGFQFGFLGGGEIRSDGDYVVPGDEVKELPE